MHQSLDRARDLDGREVDGLHAVPLVSTPPARRLVALDVTRGLLVLLMTSSHALTLAAVPSGSFWTSSYWLPRGWATLSFTILSGYTMGRVLPWRLNLPRARATVRRRARQLFAVFFASNIFFEAARVAHDGDWPRAMDPWWWVGLLTFETAYGLSGVLLPIVLVLVAAPVLFKLYVRWGWATVMTVMAAATVTSWWVGIAVPKESLPPLRVIDVLFYDGPGGFDVAPLVSAGVLGFYLGLRGPLVRHERLGITLVALAIALVFTEGMLADVAPGYLWRPSVALVQFAVVLLLGTLLTKTAPEWVGPTLGLIGQYSLFSFLTHRVILHAAATALDGVPVENTVLYFTYFLATLLALWGMCRIRQRTPIVDLRLKTVGL